MGKDTRLVNIYLNIHNKRPLTMDDLQYLALYAPDCFEKTCQNVIYNIPKAKPVLKPSSPKPPNTETALIPSARHNIETVLNNLKRLETNDFPVPDLDAEEVKNLLGNLYMELLFPHNDTDSFFDTTAPGNTSLFDQRI